MKIKTLILALIVSFGLSAQEFQGTIIYKISYDELPTEMQGYESMLPNETKVMVRDQISKSVTNNPMTGGETIILSDNANGKTMSLIDVMGEKYAITSEGSKESDDVTYEDTGEEKEIAGYKCKVASAEAENTNLTVCYTKELPAINNSNVSGLDGFPLEIIIEMEQMTMVQTVTEVKEGKIDKMKFEAPSGYTVLTTEEAKAKFKGMGGM